jgi:AcrR family transcriptional regulator
MARIKTTDVEESTILERIGLFLTNGLRGASARAITETAGIGRGTLYWIDQEL